MLFSLRVQLYGFEHAIGEEVNSAYPAKVILLLPDMLCCCLLPDGDEPVGYAVFC